MSFHFYFQSIHQTIVNSRSDIRKQVRQLRNQLSAQQRQHASQSITKNLAKTHLFRNSQRIAGFLSNDSEPDLTRLMQLAWQQYKQWHLPVIGLPNINHLWFAPYKENDTLVINRFGIGEPDTPLHQTTRSYGLDLVLMPLVAFDIEGNRLGMGKGYYDRTLKFLHLRRHWRKPRLVGIAYELQKFDQLPKQAWDIPLDVIVTEKSVYNINHLHL